MRNLGSKDMKKVAYLGLKVAVPEVMGGERETVISAFTSLVMETLEVSPFSERFMKTPDQEGRWAIFWKSQHRIQTLRGLLEEATVASSSPPVKIRGFRHSDFGILRSEVMYRHLRTDLMVTSPLSYQKATVRVFQNYKREVFSKGFREEFSHFYIDGVYPLEH